MESRIKVFGHPLHQLVVPFPIGAFGLSVLMDACYSFTGNKEHLTTARRALDFGLVTAVAAVPIGAADLAAIKPGTRAQRIGVAHGLANLTMVGLFATSRYLRRNKEASVAARCIAASAFVVSGVAAWLGGELVVRHGIGVSDRAKRDDPAALDAGEPNRSLREEKNVVHRGKQGASEKR